jgi:uncharacterized repeat protein (TIGR01451 family)
VKRETLCLTLAICAAAAGAQAKARIVVSIQQTRETTESTPAGKVTRFVPATSASPGDVLEYVLVYTNQGDEPATNAVIEDPVPKGTRYIANSAAGDGAEITFSNDNGKSFAPAVKLTYQTRLPSGAVEHRVVTPSEYTNIRWTIPRVPAGAGGKVSFRVRVN